MALAISSVLPVKNLVAVLRLGGSKIFLLEEGEPAAPTMLMSQPRSAQFQTARGFLSAFMMFIGVGYLGVFISPHTVMSAGSFTRTVSYLSGRRRRQTA